jgi:hypothetical protein
MDRICTRFQQGLSWESNMNGKVEMAEAVGLFQKGKAKVMFPTKWEGA